MLTAVAAQISAVSSRTAVGKFSMNAGRTREMFANFGTVVGARRSCPSPGLVLSQKILGDAKSWKLQRKMIRCEQSASFKSVKSLILTRIEQALSRPALTVCASEVFHFNDSHHVHTV